MFLQFLGETLAYFLQYIFSSMVKFQRKIINKGWLQIKEKLRKITYLQETMRPPK